MEIIVVNFGIAPNFEEVSTKVEVDLKLKDSVEKVEVELKLIVSFFDTTSLNLLIDLLSSCGSNIPKNTISQVVMLCVL